METTKSKKETLKQNIDIGLIALVLALVIFIFVFGIIERCKRGWTSNDTIQIVFAVFIFIIFLGCSEPFSKFLVANNKEIIICNNEIYRSFKFVEKEGKLNQVEIIYLDNLKDKCLLKMNKIVKKQKCDIEFTKENVSDFFYPNSWIYNSESKPTFSKMKKVESAYKTILRNKSLKYEKLSRDVESLEIIKKYKFPLVEVILPFLFGGLGLFITIYQTLNVNGIIKDALTDYLVLFGETFLLGIAAVFNSSTSSIESAIKDKKETIKILNQVLKK